MTSSEKFSRARREFEQRCDRDPIVRKDEHGGLAKLIDLTVSLGPLVEHLPTEDRQDYSLVFRRCCDRKVLWKVVIQQQGRTFEMLPRHFFIQHPEFFPEFAALWNAIPDTAAKRADRQTVPRMHLRYIARPDVWSQLEHCIIWAARCQ